MPLPATQHSGHKFCTTKNADTSTYPTLKTAERPRLTHKHNFLKHYGREGHPTFTSSDINVERKSWKKKTFKGKPPDWSSSFLFSSIFCKVGPLHPILPDLGANETKKTLHPSFFRHVECIFWRVTIKCQKFQDLQKRTWMDLSSSLTRPVLRDS